MYVLLSIFGTEDGAVHSSVVSTDLFSGCESVSNQQEATQWNRAFIIMKGVLVVQYKTPLKWLCKLGSKRYTKIRSMSDRES